MQERRRLGSRPTARFSKAVRGGQRVRVPPQRQSARPRSDNMETCLSEYGHAFVQLCRDPRRPRAAGHAGDAEGLGAHAARFQGGHFVRSRVRRLRVPSGAGRRAEHAAELRRARCSHLTAGCAVEATGTIVPSPAKGQPFEMQANASQVIGWVDDPDSYPIQPKPHSLEFLREVAHLRPRTNVIGAVTRVRHTIAQSIHRLFRRARLLLGQHADHHGVGCGRRRRAVPRVDARSAEPAAHAGRQESTSRRTSSGARRSSRFPASSTSRRIAWRCPRSTRSGRRFAPRTRTPAATSPSSG